MKQDLQPDRPTPQSWVSVEWEKRKLERRQAFERLQQRVLSQLQPTLMPDLVPFIRSQTDLFVANVQRLLIPLWWWPLCDIWGRIEQTALNQACQNISDWISQRADRFCFASDVIACAEWQQIQSNLADLPQLAASALGPSWVERLAMVPPAPWGLHVRFGEPLVFRFPCRLHFPRSLGLLPAGVARKWLKTHLPRESERITNAWREAAIIYAAENLLAALDRLAREAENRASEIGRGVASFQWDKTSAVEPERISESGEAELRESVPGSD